MITSESRSPGLEDGSVTLAVAQQIALPSKAPHDPRLEPQVLQRALEERLHGCRVSRVLGVGGVSACFAARMESFGRVAVKVSLRGSAEPHSWDAEAAESELCIYQMLHEDPSTSAIAPRVLSSGNLTIENLSHSYIIMDRLGSSLDNLPKAGLSTAAFVQCALGMLSCLERLHNTGLVHLDVKPANFCLRGSSPGQQVAGAPSVCIIDLGGCHERPSRQQAGSSFSFFGTTEYAGSTAMQQLHPGLADDLESLAYSLLYIWNHGELPWSFVERHLELKGGEWTQEQLKAMLEERNTKWKQACKDHITVPPFIERIRDYAIQLQVWEVPDYSVVRKLIQAAPQQRRLPAKVSSNKHPRRCLSDMPAKKRAKHWPARGSKDLPAAPLHAEE